MRWPSRQKTNRLHCGQRDPTATLKLAFQLESHRRLVPRQVSPDQEWWPQPETVRRLGGKSGRAGAAEQPEEAWTAAGHAGVEEDQRGLKEWRQ